MKLITGIEYSVGLCYCICYFSLSSSSLLLSLPYFMYLSCSFSCELLKHTDFFIYLCVPIVFHGCDTITKYLNDNQFSSVQSLSRVRLFATPWTTACQVSLSITNCQSSPKPMSSKSVMPTTHLILCRPLLLLPSIFPSIRVFLNESALRIRWPKYWNFSFNISPSNEHSGMISFRMDWLDLLAVQRTLQSLL